MKRSAALTALTTLVAVVATAAPAAAGNGANNYYLAGSCKASGVTLKASTWDYGPNAMYHWGWTRRGTGYTVKKVTLDGYRKSTARDTQIWAGGHRRHTIVITVSEWLPLGSRLHTCAITI